MAALLSDAEYGKTQPPIRQTDVIFVSLGHKNDAKLGLSNRRLSLVCTCRTLSFIYLFILFIYLFIYLLID